MQRSRIRELICSPYGYGTLEMLLLLLLHRLPLNGHANRMDLLNQPQVVVEEDSPVTTYFNYSEGGGALN